MGKKTVNKQVFKAMSFSDLYKMDKFMKREIREWENSLQDAKDGKRAYSNPKYPESLQATIDSLEEYRGIFDDLMWDKIFSLVNDPD